jgi:hypothetical protein
MKMRPQTADQPAGYRLGNMLLPVKAFLVNDSSRIRVNITLVEHHFLSVQGIAW